MIRKNQHLLNIINVCIDTFLVVVAYALASWFWLEVVVHKSTNMAALQGKTLLLAFLYALSFVLLLSVFGFYNSTRTRKLRWKVTVIFSATVISTMVATTLFYLFRLEDFSRGVLFSFVALELAFIIGKYTLMRLLFNRMRARGVNLKHVLIIGTGRLAVQYAEDLANESTLGMKVRGFVGSSQQGAMPYLGGFDSLDELLKDTTIDEAVIALDMDDIPSIRDIIMTCDKNGVRYFVVPFYNDLIPGHPVIETIGRSKLINMRANKLENIGFAAIKRAFDIVASGLGLLVLSPLMAAIAIGVKLSSPGPILFRQTRVGFRKKEFQMLKFRSMRVNSEQDTAWSTNADNRKTKFGSIIRKCSLDELPQLINVLKGDMSLVGPRPELPHFVEQFRETVPLYMVKHQVRPGITGWAQVNGYRGDTSIEKRIEMDLWYIDQWSIGLDLKILLMTVFGGMMNQEKINKDGKAGKKQ
ncbi:MAG: undecaprenyl-phosphate glucose phosphotransferase [Clostridia bacterium]|nr:undecaprenyl-phosphate glucose phosphotransferase [Clostridia bacterium]